MSRNPTQEAFRRAARRFLKHLMATQKARVVEVGRSPDSPEGKAMVYQNAVRVLLEEIFEEAIPFDQEFVAQMGARSASYALSVAPIEDQDEIVASVLRGFAEMHMLRCAQGIRINSGWGDERALRPNFDD